MAILLSDSTIYSGEPFTALQCRILGERQSEPFSMPRALIRRLCMHFFDCARALC